MASNLKFGFFVLFSMVAAIIASMLDGRVQDNCLKAGLLAARQSLATTDAVSAALCPDTINNEKILEHASWKPRLLAQETLS